MDITQKSNEKEILSLIEELKQYDNNEGYKLSYDEVKKKLESIKKNLIEYGVHSLEYLHPLLEHEETWSCLFALEILKEIKSEKSIFPFIDFIKKNEDSDYWESCDEALWALIAIGEPAVEPLLNEVKSDFAKKQYFGYLVNALTGIKHSDVYSFMIEILKDYVDNTNKYDEWFEIDNFVYDFSVQGNKEVLSILKKLFAMDHLSENEKREIESTIEVMENPEKFNKEVEELARQFKKFENLNKEDVNEKELLEKAVDYELEKRYDKALECVEKILVVYPKSYHALFLNARINRKLGMPIMIFLGEALEQAKKQKASQEVLDLMEEERSKIVELYREMESTADEELEINFRCSNCNKKRNLKTGLIWQIEDKNKFFFENEIMCKHCFSHDMKLTKDGEMQIIRQKMRLMMGEATGILSVGKKVVVENKVMPFNKTYSYLLRRIKENPLNGELYLRAGNSARKQNKHEEAIKHYKKAIELNPKLIAVYINFVEIYVYRYDYYEINEAKENAIYYLKKLRQVYDLKDYNNATLKNFGSVIEFIREKEAKFKLSSDYKMLKDEEVRNSIKDASTFDINSISENIKKVSEQSEQKIRRLLKENKGVIVYESYHVFDKKTKESQRLDISNVMPIELSKLCICGSGNYLKQCCFNKVKRKIPFVANIDFETYSVLKEIEKEIKIDEEYNSLLEDFKEDPRFYCDNETKISAFFLYYGNTFFTVKNLGTVVFGTINIKKIFDNKSNIKIEALSQNRFDSLHRTIKEHLVLE